MSTGQRLNMIEAVLDQIRAAIDQESLKLAASATTPQVSDTGYHDFWRRVGAFRPRIENLMSQLKSMGHSLDLRRQGLWNMPRERRYSARQSIGDQDRHLQRVQAKALNVMRSLEALDRRGGTPTDADLLKGFHKLIKEAGGFAREVDTQALTQQLNEHFTPNQPPGVGAPSWGSVALLLTLLTLYFRRGPKDD